MNFAKGTTLQLFEVLNKNSLQGRSVNFALSANLDANRILKLSAHFDPNLTFLQIIAAFYEMSLQQGMPLVVFDERSSSAAQLVVLNQPVRTISYIRLLSTNLCLLLDF